MHFTAPTNRRKSARDSAARLGARHIALCLTAGLLSACDPDLDRIGTLNAEDLPPSPTNAYADDPEAAVLGQALFFEPRMSADGQLACSSCHDPDHAFADPRPFSLGAFGREGERHAPTLMNVAFNTFQLWDGRADSLWSQPIKAIEAEAEGDFTRTELAHFIAAEYAEAYVAVFGPLPDVSRLPARARPGDAAWASMSEADRDAVNRVAANVGKAIEAYERKLLCVDTEWDRFMRGEINLPENAIEGAEDFLEDGGDCEDCHSGPNLTDGAFHNLGLDHPGEADFGRSAGVEQLFDDVFNGVGAYSDDPEAGARALAEVTMGDARDVGAFKTPGLRGVAQRDRFGHLGHEDDLVDWIDDVYDRPRRRGDRGDANFVGELSPEFPRGVDGGDARQIARFLRTLDCPPLPEHLTRAPMPHELPTTAE